MEPRKSRTSSITSIAIVAACVAAGIIMYSIFHLPPGSISAERKAAAAGETIRLALEKYARAHQGEYPPTESVMGGSSQEDALLENGYISFYPKNPCSGEKPVVNSTVGFSSCDFVYKRLDPKTYHFRLSVYGAKPSSGRAKEGIIYSYSYSY